MPTLTSRLLVLVLWIVFSAGALITLFGVFCLFEFAHSFGDVAVAVYGGLGFGGLVVGLIVMVIGGLGLLGAYASRSADESSSQDKGKPS